jgi:hypothetical protein
VLERISAQAFRAGGPIRGEAFMAEHVIDRRQVLRGAGVAAGGAAVGAVAFAAPAVAHDNRGGTLSGSWLITRQDDGTTSSTTGVLSFAGGAVMVEHDINPAGPPFTGTWEGHDDRRFQATFWSGESGNAPGQPGPTVRVRLRGQVRHGNLTATYAFTAFDPSTGAVVQSGTGKVLNGHRIEA